MTSLLRPGVHTVDASQSIARGVCGDDNVGSDGYAGGSDSQIIHPVV